MGQSEATIRTWRLGVSKRRAISQGKLAVGGTTWRSPSGAELDLIEGDESWLTEAITEAQTNRDGQGLPVMPLPYLVLLKLRASRAQDIADVSRMMGQADEGAIRRTVEVVGRLAPEDLPDLQSLIDLGRLELQ